MDIIQLLEIAEATIIIFEYGVKPVEGDFREFTAEQYVAVKKTNHRIKNDTKLYSWIPPKHAYKSREVLTATREEKNLLLEAANNIDRHVLVSKRSFANYTEKLHYVASFFPPELSEGTAFDRRRPQLAKLS